MTSGLSFNEDYTDHSGDVIQMLFVKGDKAGFAASKSLQYPPGVYWSVFKRHLEHHRSDIATIASPRARNICVSPRATIRTSGHAQCGARARRSRDVCRIHIHVCLGARLGAAWPLVLTRWQWQGQRLLPEGWVAYSLTPTQGAPDARYGAHVWLKLPESPGLGEPPMPEDTYYMLGYEEQVVAVVPSRDLVIVRLGITREEGAWDHARDLAPIVNAVPLRP